MKRQVGTIALRSKDGSFLPSSPIYRETGKEEPVLPEKTSQELIDLFYEKFAQHKAAQERGETP